MNTATQQLAHKIVFKAKELQTTKSFLLCALQVIHVHKYSLDAMEQRLEMDHYISRALIRQLMEDLTIKAKKNLMSPLPKKMQEGCQAIELMNETDLDNNPLYKAYKPIIQSIIKDAPIMHLHLQAVAMAAGITSNLRSKYRKATITEILLQNCFEEIDHYSKTIMVLEPGIYSEQRYDMPMN